jgi:hypothetical protein
MTNFHECEGFHQYNQNIIKSADLALFRPLARLARLLKARTFQNDQNYGLRSGGFCYDLASTYTLANHSTLLRTTTATVNAGGVELWQLLWKTRWQAFALRSMVVRPLADHSRRSAICQVWISSQVITKSSIAEELYLWKGRFLNLSCDIVPLMCIIYLEECAYAINIHACYFIY